MIQKLSVLFLFLILVLPGAAGAASLPSVGLRDVVVALERPFQEETHGGEAIRDFRGDFFQESRLASLDRLQRGRGWVAVKFDRNRPGQVPLTMFRWEYQQPTRQEIVSDGRTLWVYLPENRQVIRSDIEFTAEARPDDPMTFLTGLGNLSRDFRISWAEPNQDVEGNYILELQPRRVSTMIRRLLIVVDREAVNDFVRSGVTGRVMPILSSTVIDPNDNTTLIEFSDIRVNVGLSANQFDFILPPGVEVIRPTGAEMGF